MMGLLGAIIPELNKVLERPLHVCCSLPLSTMLYFDKMFSLFTNRYLLFILKSLSCVFVGL